MTDECVMLEISGDYPCESGDSHRIGVPKKGELPVKSFRYLGKALPEIFSLKEKNRGEIPAVKILLEKDKWDIMHEVDALWIEQRGEWVGVEYSRWRETSSMDLERYDGPFALDRACRMKLLEAYRRPETELENIHTLDPEQFRRGDTSLLQY